MPKVMRKSVFETNSSSTHSICISESKCVMDKLPFEEDGTTIFIHPGEFGWEVEDYFDAATKASYCMMFATTVDPDGGYDRMLQEVIKEETGAKMVLFVEGEGYIDHQSHDVAREAFKSKEALRNFIFNPNSRLHTDNDNY